MKVRMQVAQVLVILVAMGTAALADGGVKQPQGSQIQSQTGNLEGSENVAMSEVEYVDGPLAPLYDFLIQRRLHKFCKLLRDAGLEEFLIGLGGYWTIFVPTDASFVFLPSGTLQNLQRNPQQLRDFLLYHFILGDFPSSQMQNDLVSNSVQGSPLIFNIYGQIVTVSGAQITEPDLEFQTGRIHIIDRPLYPIPQQDTTSYLRTSNQRLYRLLQDTGIIDYVSSGQFTILAPNDEAFNYLSDELKDMLTANRTLAEKIVLNHILPGNVFTGGIVDGMQWETVGGEIITFTIKRGLVFANGVPIVLPDVPFTNGVIHVLNRVLLPEGIESDCHCKPSADNNRKSHTTSSNSGILPGIRQTQPQFFTSTTRTPFHQGSHRQTPQPQGRPTPVSSVRRPTPRTQTHRQPITPPPRQPVPPRSGQTHRSGVQSTASPRLDIPLENRPEDDQNIVINGVHPDGNQKAAQPSRYPPPPSRRISTPQTQSGGIPSGNFQTPSSHGHPSQGITPSVPSTSSRWWSTRPQTSASPRTPSPNRIPLTTRKPATTWSYNKVTSPSFSPAPNGNTYQDHSIITQVPQQNLITQRPGIGTTVMWQNRPSVAQSTSRPNQIRTTYRPPRVPPPRAGPQLRPGSFPTPAPVLPQTSDQPFESNRQCRRRDERLSSATQNLPLCPESPTGSCQDQPYNPNDSRPPCPTNINSGCRYQNEPFNPSDNRPLCTQSNPGQNCRNINDPTYIGDRRPVCSQNTADCRDPSVPASPTDHRPLCIINDNNLDSLTSSQGITPNQGCRSPSESTYPGDTRPICTSTNERGNDCRPATQRPTAGDRRPVCSQNRQPQSQQRPQQTFQQRPQQRPDHSTKGQRLPTNQNRPPFSQNTRFPTQSTRSQPWRTTAQPIHGTDHTEQQYSRPTPSPNRPPLQPIGPPTPGSQVPQPQHRPQQPRPISSRPGYQSPGLRPQQPGVTQPQQVGVQPQQPGYQSQQPGVQPQQPGVQPQQPGVQTQQPGVQPQQPGAQPPQPGYQPQQPGYQPQQPGPQPPQPGYQPQQPGYQPQQPGYQPQQPGYQPQQPGQQPQQPGQQQRQPGYQPQQPGNQPQQPSYQPQKPGHQLQQPGYQSQQPGFQAQQPGVQRQQPGVQRQQPGYQPQQPGHQPHPPNHQPQQPGYQPQQPVHQPQQPGHQSHQSSHQPQQPGHQPQQPGYQSQQPGIQPQQPGYQSQQPASPLDENTQQQVPFQPQPGLQTPLPGVPQQPGSVNHQSGLPTRGPGSHNQRPYQPPRSTSRTPQPGIQSQQPSQPQRPGFQQPRPNDQQGSLKPHQPAYPNQQPGPESPVEPPSNTRNQVNQPQVTFQPGIINRPTPPGPRSHMNPSRVPGGFTQPSPISQNRPISNLPRPGTTPSNFGRSTTPRLPISVTGTSTTPGEDTRRTLYEIVEDPALLIRGTPVKLTKIFSLFHKAGLQDLLVGPGPTTVFLPSDDAFATLPKGVIDQLEENPELLRQVLLYHITNVEILPSGQAESYTVPSIEGNQLVITMTQGGKLIIISGAKAIAVTKANNGIFYVINQLLYPLPPTDIVGAIKSRPDLSILSWLLPQSGLEEILQGEAPYTFLAPTDNAFAQLSPTVYEELTQNTTALQEILLNHLLEGAHYGREFISGGTFQSSRGGKLKFQIVSYGYQVNDINIKTPEIVTGTGVIHLIDQIIFEKPDLQYFSKFENSVTDDGINSPNLDPSGPLNNNLIPPGQTGTGPTHRLIPGQPQITGLQPAGLNPGVRNVPSQLPGHRQGSGLPHLGGQTPSGGPFSPGQRQQPSNTPGGHRPSGNSPHNAGGRTHSVGQHQAPRPTGVSGVLSNSLPQSHSTGYVGNANRRQGSDHGSHQPGHANSIGDSNSNVADLAKSMGLNKFADWVTGTGLLEKIHDGGVYTVFAPTDDAVNSLPQDMIYNIGSNPQQTKPILEYHIVPQRLNINSLRNDETSSTLLQGKSIRFNVYNTGQVNCKQLVTASGTPVGESLATMGSVQLIPITQVLYQPAGNLLNIVDNSPLLHNLSQAIRSARITWVLSGSGPLTFFAPSDTAFQSLSPEQRKNLVDDKQAFTNLLKRHLVGGTYFSSGVQEDVEKQSESNQPMKLSLQGGVLTVNSIPVTYSDVTATNGVLHVVDQFL